MLEWIEYVGGCQWGESNRRIARRFLKVCSPKFIFLGFLEVPSLPMELIQYELM